MGKTYIERSRTMTTPRRPWDTIPRSIPNAPILAFLPGTHGNFLARCLSVASGVVPDFDFYTDHKGAHANRQFKSVVEFTHDPKEKDIFCYIGYDKDDDFILTWHLYYAASEFGFDLLTVESFDVIQEFIDKSKETGLGLAAQDKNKNKSLKPLMKNLVYGMDSFKHDGVSGLREMFKKGFATGGGMWERQNYVMEKYNIYNTFQFSWLYNKKMFSRQIENLCVKLGYEYKVDVTHHIDEFIDKKQDIIQANAFVNRAFNSYRDKKDMDISSLSIYEQAYLDHLIESHHNYEIENWITYPTNTKDMQPVQTWEGKRYDL